MGVNTFDVDTGPEIGCFRGAKGRRVEAVFAGVLVAFLSAALPSISFQDDSSPWVGKRGDE